MGGKGCLCWLSNQGKGDGVARLHGVGSQPRAGSSKEWTLEQRPECTRLIAARLPLSSGLSPSPAQHVCRSSSQVRGRGWAGEGPPGTPSLTAIGTDDSGALLLPEPNLGPYSVGREGWAPVAVPSTKYNLPQRETKGLHLDLDLHSTAWV